MISQAGRFRPDKVRSVGRTPTPETVAAMTEAREMAAARFDSAEEPFDALDRVADGGKANASNEEA